jgi:mRNA interferase HigB
MRIIKERTLRDYVNQSRYRAARDSMEAWIFLARYSRWINPADLKSRLRSVSIITARRAVFNIKGNQFRLVVDINYRFGVIYVIWFGSHAEYDKIDVRKIRYGD